jgi:anti-sigma factor RsiW
MNTSDEIAFRHRQAWDLIPWVVNGRASPEQRAVVEQHLADCGDCREEYAFQQRLAGAMRSAPEPAGNAQAALQDLWRRIDGDEQAPRPARRVAGGGFARGLLAAVIVEAVGLAVLSGALWTRTQAAAVAPVYHTLSAPQEAAPRASIRAVLAPSLTLGQLQTLLAQSQLQIVGGPSDAGVYSLAPLSTAAADGGAALARLRADPGVRFAEPVDAAQRPAP